MSKNPNNSFKFNYTKLKTDIKNNITSKIVRWIFITLLASVLAYYINTPNKFVTTFIIILSIFVIIIIYYVFRQQDNLKYKVVIIIGVVLVIGSVVYYQMNKEIDPCDKLETLHDYWECDFKNALFRSEAKLVYNDELGKMAASDYEIMLSADFEAKSIFIIYYIPDLLPHVKNTVSFAKQLAIATDTLLNKFIKLVNMEKVSTTDKTIQLDQLVFTRAVYIYHEEYIYKEDLSQLEELYKKNNLSVHFRGNEYLEIKKRNIELEDEGKRIPYKLLR